MHNGVPVFKTPDSTSTPKINGSFVLIILTIYLL